MSRKGKYHYAKQHKSTTLGRELRAIKEYVEWLQNKEDREIDWSDAPLKKWFDNNYCRKIPKVRQRGS